MMPGVGGIIMKVHTAAGIKMIESENPKPLQKAYNLSDASIFFEQIANKTWINQLVLAPHIYCPGVTGATTCYNGTQLYDGLDVSFGYLTVAPGYCVGGSCRVSLVGLRQWG